MIGSRFLIVTDDRGVGELIAASLPSHLPVEVVSAAAFDSALVHGLVLAAIVDSRALDAGFELRIRAALARGSLGAIAVFLRSAREVHTRELEWASSVIRGAPELCDAWPRLRANTVEWAFQNLLVHLRARLGAADPLTRAFQVAMRSTPPIGTIDALASIVGVKPETLSGRWCTFAGDGGALTLHDALTWVVLLRVIGGRNTSQGLRFTARDAVGFRSRLYRFAKKMFATGLEPLEGAEFARLIEGFIGQVVRWGGGGTLRPSDGTETWEMGPDSSKAGLPIGMRWR